MCGIAGIFSFSDPAKQWPDEHTPAMLEGIRHRGPDGTGDFADPGFRTVHARLAIIDPSPAGKQPMLSADGRFVVSYNGEIYNFREIRRELESHGRRFVSGSDTEVLLAAWQEWGEGAPERLDGIFAFALYDRHERRLFLVRDPLGIKPLFYYVAGGEIVFASELHALFGPWKRIPPPDPCDLDAYFTFNYLPAPRTGLRGVFQLEAGCLLQVDADGERLRRYWRIPYRQAVSSWSDSLVEEFKAVLGESVRMQMVSDVPVGLFLSGGLDSYSVAASSVSAGHSPAAFTLGFQEGNFDERPAAEEYARQLGIGFRPVLFRWDEEILRETLGCMRELLADASCFPLYQLCAHARKDATVILAGDGGDELLAGYDTYRAGEMTPLLRCIPRGIRKALAAAARFLPSDNERYGKRMVAERLLAAAAAGPQRDHASFRRIFGDEAKRTLYSPDFLAETAGGDPVGEYAFLIGEVPPNRSYLAGRQHADILFHLPSIMAKVDRMSMARGLEVRVPLLSKRMVEFCVNLPDDAKRAGGKGKRILRAAWEGKIPPSALRRRKAGFLPPVDRWFREDGAMVEVFGDHLNRAKNRRLPHLAWNRVDALWKRHREGAEEAGFLLLGVLQYVNWGLAFL